MDVRVRINGRTFLLSEDEFLKLVLGMTPANPVDVLDFVRGKGRGERQHCRSPLFSFKSAPFSNLSLCSNACHDYKKDRA